MKKEKFLEELQTALAGEVGQQALIEHISYYDDYIMTQIRSGTIEEEVIDSLGEPRLLAKTIIETSSDADHMAKAYQYEESPVIEEDGEEAYPKGVYRITGIKAILIVALIIVVVLGIMSLALKIFWALLPILLVGIFIFMVVAFLKKLFH